MKVEAFGIPAAAVGSTPDRPATRQATPASPQPLPSAHQSSPVQIDAPAEIHPHRSTSRHQRLSGPQGQQTPGFGLRQAGSTRGLHPTGVAERLANRTLAARVDALCERWNRPDSPGCVIAVMRGDDTILRTAYGMANLEEGVPLSADTVFRIASASKQFTAYCVLLLARDQLLSLDDEIHQYLPDLPPTPEPITIRHLLHHIGGLREYVVRDGEQLLLQRGPQTIGPFEPVADDLFWSAGMTLAFRRDEAGKILGYHLSTNGARGLWFAESPHIDSSSTQRRRATTPR